MLHLHVDNKMSNSRAELMETRLGAILDRSSLGSKAVHTLFLLWPMA